jgi:aryl-alcohol dehydrogenase
MSKNTTQIKAAVVREKGGPFSIETLSLESPRRDEVLVKVVATGLCHTDMVARDKVYPVPHPIVLGHEGAGIVESVGADVVKVAPGDSVVLTYLTCGRCKPCRLGRTAHCEKTFPLCFGGARLDGSTATFDGQGEKVHDHFFGQSSFATYALANERNVVKVSSDVPLERLGPLGCGIQTGAGAVMNALNVRPGTSFASFSVGAVGCSAIMAARAVGATTIIAIDIVPSRLEMAKELGATHAINSKQTNPVEAIRDITGGGVEVIQTPDFVARAAIGSLNKSDTRELLWRITAPTLVIVGEKDIITSPAESRALSDGIPNSTLTVIENAGHFPMLEQPIEFNRALRVFLEEHASPSNNDG